MHHEPCRFVHDQDVLVFEDYGYGDLLGRETFLGDLRLHALSGPHFIGRIGRPTVDEKEIVHDESLHEAAADPEPPGGQPVDPLPGLCGVYSEGLYGAPSLDWTTKPLLTPAQEAARPEDAAVCLLAFLRVEELLRAALFGQR